jgi:CheY-like chemotaxis protein
VATELRKKNHDSPRILIVDDDPGQRSLLNTFLRTQGFGTVTADSGQHAL